MPALTKYGVDTHAAHASHDRDTYRRVTCDFVASGSGSYYSRSCDNLAQWAEAYESEGVLRLPALGNYITKRCHRHRAIDERTAANRGYGARPYLPYDGMGIAKQVDRDKAGHAEALRLDGILANVAEYARYILKHAELTEGQVGTLESIRDEAKGNLLVVR